MSTTKSTGKKRNSDENDGDEQSEQTTVTSGRKPHTAYPFAPVSAAERQEDAARADALDAFFSIHQQVLRTKDAVPVISGPPFPRRPGPSSATNKWRNAARAWASATAALMIPWGGNGEPLSEIPARGYEEVVRWIKDPNNRAKFADRARIAALNRMDRVLYVDAAARKTCAVYRGAYATRWSRSTEPSNDNSDGEDDDIIANAHQDLTSTGSPSEPSDDDILSRGEFNEEELAEARNIIDVINALNSTEGRSATKVREAEYLDAVSKTLGGLFSSNEKERDEKEEERTHEKKKTKRSVNNTGVTATYDNNALNKTIKAIAEVKPLAPSSSNKPGSDDDPKGKRPAETRPTEATSSTSAPRIEPTILIPRPNSNEMRLNDEQVAVVNYVGDWWARRSSSAQGSSPGVASNSSKDAQGIHGDDDQLFLLLHGGPGVGKSTVIRSLLNVLGDPTASRHVRCCAPTGIAACVLVNGATTHSLFGFSPRDTTAARGIGLGKLTEDKVTALQSLEVLICDEMSMVAPELLVGIDERLRSVRKRPNVPFGGVSVILCGDFYQLPPVTGSSLYEVAMVPPPEPDADAAGADREKAKSKKVARKDVSSKAVRLTASKAKGRDLIQMFKLFELRVNMRAREDAAHAAYLNRFREPEFKINVDEMLKRYKVISKDDVTRDPTWRQAPIVVAGNNERRRINIESAARFARERGQPLVLWALDPARHLGSINTRDLFKRLAEGRDRRFDLIGAFVTGAPAMLGANTNTAHGLVNGAHIRLHGLYITDPSDVDAVESASPGDIVWLQNPPAAVLYTVPGMAADKWPKAASLGTAPTGEPILAMTHAGHAQGAATASVVFHDPHRGTKHSINVKTFPYELAFAITYHKVQGQTLDRVILDLNAATQRNKVSIDAFYVGLSRSRTAEGLRVLPLEIGITRHHLAGLTGNMKLAEFLSKFKKARTAHGVPAPAGLLEFDNTAL